MERKQMVDQWRQEMMGVLLSAFIITIIHCSSNNILIILLPRTIIRHYLPNSIHHRSRNTIIITHCTSHPTLLITMPWKIVN